MICVVKKTIWFRVRRKHAINVDCAFVVIVFYRLRTASDSVCRDQMGSDRCLVSIV